MNTSSQPVTIQPGPDWTTAEPQHIPSPTLWPAFVGLSATLLVWGLITSSIIFGIGVCVFGISMAGWIGDLRHERAKTREQ